MVDPMADRIVAVMGFCFGEDGKIVETLQRSARPFSMLTTIFLGRITLGFGS